MPDTSASTLACTFFRDSHDNTGVRVATTWPRLIERLSRHEAGTKDGPGLACATFSGLRRNECLIDRSMIALDIEASRTTGEVPISFAAMVSYLAARRVRAMCWTTHSHTAADPRYRVLLPLVAPLPYDPLIDPFLTAAAAAQLRCHGVADPSKFGAASLFYLPRHPEDGLFATQAIEGDPVDVGMLLTMATTMAERVAQDEAEVAARRRANAMPPALLAKIEAYNAGHPIEERLIAYGYRREGSRWRSPLQHGQGATVVLPGGARWVSFSQSDADGSVGALPARSSSQCTSWGDGFALFTRWEHGGSFRRALAALPDVEVVDAAT